MSEQSHSEMNIQFWYKVNMMLPQRLWRWYNILSILYCIVILYSLYRWNNVISTINSDKHNHKQKFVLGSNKFFSKNVAHI